MKSQLFHHLMGSMLAGLLVVQVGFAQTATERIDAARARLESSGLPGTLLDQRLAEGRAKGIALDVIAAALEQRTEALVAAGAALRPAIPSPNPAELSAGADAIEAGIPAQALRQVVAGARAEDRAVAIAVLTFLREQGLPVDEAVGQVTRAAAEGPAALRDLPARARGNGPGVRGRPANPGANGNRPGAAGQRPAGGRPDGLPPPGQREPDRPGRAPG